MPLAQVGEVGGGGGGGRVVLGSAVTGDGGGKVPVQEGDIRGIDLCGIFTHLCSTNNKLQPQG